MRLFWCTMCFPPSSSFGTQTTDHGGFERMIAAKDAKHCLTELTIKLLYRFLDAKYTQDLKHYVARMDDNCFTPIHAVRTSDYLLKSPSKKKHSTTDTLYSLHFIWRHVELRQHTHNTCSKDHKNYQERRSFVNHGWGNSCTTKATNWVGRDSANK